MTILTETFVRCLKHKLYSVNNVVRVCCYTMLKYKINRLHNMNSVLDCVMFILKLFTSEKIRVDLILNDIKISKPVRVVTDGACAMVGTNKTFVSHLRNDDHFPPLIHYQCQ